MISIKKIAPVLGVLMVLALCSNLPNARAQVPQTSQVMIGNHAFSVQYSITGGAISTISADTSMTSLIVNLSTSSGGTLSIQIPRALLDSKSQNGSADDDFLIFIDDVPSTDFTQPSSDSSQRTLNIPFDDATHRIEIIGTVMPASSSTSGGAVNTPEFGIGSLTMVVLPAAIIAIIAISSKLRGFHLR